MKTRAKCFSELRSSISPPKEVIPRPWPRRRCRTRLHLFPKYFLCILRRCLPGESEKQFNGRYLYERETAFPMCPPSRQDQEPEHENSPPTPINTWSLRISLQVSMDHLIGGPFTDVPLDNAHSDCLNIRKSTNTTDEGIK